MDEPNGKKARLSPKTASISNLAENHIRHDDVILRQFTNSAFPTDPAIDPVSLGNAIELESLSHSQIQEAHATPPTAVKVPRSERRGLFARATILAELEDPYQYSYRTKWFIVFVVAYAAAAAPLGSAIIFRMWYFIFLEKLCPG